MRETQSDGAASTRSTVTAAVCWIFAGVIYLLAEAVAAAAFDHYSYAINYISDLGVPDIEMLGTRHIDSPLHMVINIAFVAQGLLFAIAATSMGRSLSLRLPVITFALVHAVGMVIIAVVHGGQHNNVLGLGWVHLLGAFLAFFGGHLTAICIGSSLLKHRRNRLIGVASISIGIIGILGIVMLQVDVRGLPETVLPDGVWERIGMYSIVAWELLFGTVLLRRLRQMPLSKAATTDLD